MFLLNSFNAFMYFYNFFDKFLLFNDLIFFKKQIIFFISGFFNENFFKFLRLKIGFYRQNFSYMFRVLIPYGKISFNQIYFLSYLIFKYDKYYFHLTTRSNIQFDWIKLFNFFDILLNLFKFNINSFQSSGNCVRNITDNNILSFINEFFCEILRQWFTLNNDFLFLPRKFKISVSDNIYYKSYLKINDLGFFIKKNYNKIFNFNFFLGGGLGRNPILSFYFLKNIHWKFIVIYCEKILRFYNTYGFRNNIYKSRIKILLKFIIKDKFLFYIKNEINFLKNKFLILNEKEINKILKYFKTLIRNLKILNKNLIYNKFFLNWLRFNVLNKNLLIINLKIFNKQSGCINFMQINYLNYISFKSKFKFLKLSFKQNLLLFDFDYYYFFINFKKFFFIFNNNLINDIITCPGKDYCSLANSKSIIIYKLIQNKIFNLNILININYFSLNISGCINSCSHHHISNIGFIGFNKNFNEYYQIYIGGYLNKYNNINFSKPIYSSISINFLLIKLFYLIKIFLKNRFLKENFENFFNYLGYYNFKKFLI